MDKEERIWKVDDNVTVECARCGSTDKMKFADIKDHSCVACDETDREHTEEAQKEE